MGQEEVLKVLEKNKGWMINGEIAGELDIARENVNRALRILFKDGEVMKKEIPTRRRWRSYQWKFKD